MNLLPELPLVLRRMVSQYGLPSTKDDVEVLRDLGATDKDFMTIFDTNDPKRAELLLEHLLLPDKTINQKKFKLKRFAYFIKPYLPTIRYLYSELQGEDIDTEILINVCIAALKNDDFQFAKEIFTRLLYSNSESSQQKYIFERIMEDISVEKVTKMLIELRSDNPYLFEQFEQNLRGLEL